MNRAISRRAFVAGAAATFLRIYTLPVKNNELPAKSRLAPAW